MCLSVVSINTNGFSEKKVEILNKIKRVKCDVACLQEVHVIPDGTKEWVKRNYGLHFHYNSQPHAGTAIITREAVEMEYVIPQTLMGRVSHVRLTSGVHVLSIYMPTQKTGNQAKVIEFIENLKRYTEPIKRKT
jgi:exonuclease III